MTVPLGTSFSKQRTSNVWCFAVKSAFSLRYSVSLLVR